MKTVRNVLANWAAFVFGTAITFVLSPFVVHHLGEVRYGIWAVTGSIVGYLGLLDLGIRIGVTRFVALYAARRDQAAMNRVVSTALALFLAAGVVAGLIGFAMAGLAPHFVKVPPEMRHVLATAIWICGLSVTVALIGSVCGGVIAGLQRFTVLNGIDLSTEVLRAAGVVAALSAGRGLISLAAIQLGIVALRGVLYAIAAHRIEPNLRVARTLFDVPALRDIVRFSGYTMVLHVLAVVIFQSDAVVIAAIMPVAQVTFFVIAGNLCQAALSILGGMSRALFPAVAARQAVDGVAGAKTLVLKAVRLGSLIVLPIAVTFLARGRTFIALWMGPSLAPGAGAVLVILAAGLCLFASYQVLTTSMMALDLQRSLIPAFVAEAALNFVLSIVLGLAIGVNGVAWGTTIPRLLVSIFCGTWFVRRHFQVPYLEYAVHAWIRPLVSMIPFGVASVAVDRAWSAPNLLVFFAQVALLLPIAAIGIWAAALESEERSLLRAGMGAAVGRTQRVLFGNSPGVP